MPGELQFIEEEKRRKEGIEVPEKVWKEVTEAAKKLGIDWEKAIIED